MVEATMLTGLGRCGPTDHVMMLHTVVSELPAHVVTLLSPLFPTTDHSLKIPTTSA